MRLALLILLVVAVVCSFAQLTPLAQTSTPKASDTVYLLRPTYIFDGESAQLHNGWVVLVRG